MELIPNKSECLFLRCWYATKGCECHFTDSGRAAIETALKARYSSGFNRGEIREEVLRAFINSTARQEVTYQAAKAKKEKNTCSIERFLEKLKQLKGNVGLPT